VYRDAKCDTRFVPPSEPSLTICVLILYFRWDEAENMLGTILIIILILLLVGALPTWGYSSGWGYYPGGTLGIILIIVIVLVLMGRI
jgi:hypothetical protein